jgi:hypothetical protein
MWKLTWKKKGKLLLKVTRLVRNRKAFQIWLMRPNA